MASENGNVLLAAPSRLTPYEAEPRKDRRMSRKKLLAIITLAFAIMFPVVAYAATAGGPGPIITSPGPYFQQGDIVNVCVNLQTRASYIETQSTQLGNCASGYTQLSILASPNGDSDPFQPATFYLNSTSINPTAQESGIAFFITDQGVTPQVTYDCMFTVPTLQGGVLTPGVVCTKH